MSTTGDCNACIIVSAPLNVATGAAVLVVDGVVQAAAMLGEAVDEFAEKEQKKRESAATEKLAADMSISRTLKYNSVQNASNIAHTEYSPPVVYNTPEEAMRFALRQSFTSAGEARVAQAHDPTQKPMDQKTMEQRTEQIRASLFDASKLIGSLEEIELQAAKQGLLLTVAAARSAKVPQHHIQQAERALGKPVKEIQDATRVLKEALQEVESALSEKERLRRQVDYQLEVIISQLYYVNQTLAEAEIDTRPEFAEASQRVRRLVALSRDRLHERLEEATSYAAEAQQVVDTLSERASESLVDGWSHAQGQINTILGKLSMLKQMAQEAEAARMSGYEKLQGLTRRITTTSTEAQEIGKRASLNGQAQLTSLAEQVETLKDELFGELQAYQQRTIAEAVAATLADLNFQSVAGGRPAVEVNDDMMRVAVVKVGVNAQGKPDDKLVEFGITREGRVSYDFSGYLDDACIVEAERIFSALRARGIYLLESEVVRQLQAEHSGRLTRHMLDRAQQYAHPVRNKVQTELADRLQRVLKLMQYNNVQVRSMGGCIELDAFNGSLGYHVVLEPEGAVQVYKDAQHTDVSSDPFDPIVAESLLITELDESSSIDDSVEREPRKQQQRTLRDQRRKQMLENG
jgi:hypothetical protein